MVKKTNGMFTVIIRLFTTLLAFKMNFNNVFTEGKRSTLS